MRADIVYLVKYVDSDDDAANEFYSKIMRELEQNYQQIQVKEVFLNLWDLYECMEGFRKIILDAGENHVYVNVSTGTKITSIAGMLSCMMWNAHPYYAPISYVGKKTIIDVSEHVSESYDLPTYSIKQPKPEFMLILDVLNRHEGCMRKSLLIEELEGMNVIKSLDMDGNKLSSPAKHNRLRALLDPMEIEWNLITVRTSGRSSEVSVQEQGITALKIFGINNNNDLQK